MIRGCRPASTTPATSWPVLTAEVTPTLDTDDVDVHGRGARRAADDVDVGRDPRAAAVDLRRRHPLRHDVVEARHDVRRASRSTRCSAIARPLPDAPRTCSRSRTPATRRTCRSPTSPAARRGSRGRSTASRSRREHGGPARLLVPHLYFWKSAKWVAGLRAARPRRARLLGAQRLPRPRRPVARAALPGRLTRARRRRSRLVADGDGRRDHARDARARRRSASRLDRPVAPSRRASTTSCASPRPTATPRRARTRSRRRPTTPTRSSSPSSGSTTARCRRFLHDDVQRRRRARGARADRRLVRVGRRRRRRCSSAAARASCR